MSNKRTRKDERELKEINLRRHRVLRDPGMTEERTSYNNAFNLIDDLEKKGYKGFPKDQEKKPLTRGEEITLELMSQGDFIPDPELASSERKVRKPMTIETMEELVGAGIAIKTKDENGRDYYRISPKYK